MNMDDDGLRHTIEAAAEAAAERTIRDTFRVLGVDLADQGQLNEFRADLDFVRKRRHFYEKSSWRAWLVVLTVVVAGAVSFFWTGFLDTIKK